MMTGQVTAQREAIVPIRVYGSAGRSVEVNAVLDTGFTGYITLSSAHISDLDLTYHSSTTATLADGSQVALARFEATIEWESERREVLALAAEGGSLLGMSLLYGTQLTATIVDGGDVTITPL